MDEKKAKITQEPLLQDNVDNLLPYESDEFSEYSEFYITLDGKKAVNRRRIRIILNAVGNSVLTSFLLLARLGGEAPMKYLLSCASIPLEIIGLVVQIKNLIDKEKPLRLFVVVILSSLVSIGILAITDAVKWSGWTGGVLATIAACGPFLFAAFMLAVAVVNIVGAVNNAKDLYHHPHYRTPLKKLSLVNKIVKASGCILMAALLVPFALILTANPVGATVLLGLIIGVAVGLVVWKIVKTLKENYHWKRTTNSLGKVDPYVLLGVDKKIVEMKLTEENNIRKNFLLKLKGVVQKKWHSHFGNSEKKQEIEMQEKSLACRYIQQCYEHKLMLAKKTNLLDNSKRLALYQEAYDLIRKPKGRLRYESLRQESSHLSVGVSAGSSSQEERNAALQADRYLPIFAKLPSRIPVKKESSTLALISAERPTIIAGY